MNTYQRPWQFKRPTILLDYDDVLVDTLPYLISNYNARTHSSLRIEEITNWDLSKFGDWRIFHAFLTDPAFWRNVPDKGDALLIVQQLINDGRYDIFIGTASNSIQEYQAKVEHIEQRIPGFNLSKIIPIKDKAKFRADVIVDDGLHNLKECAEFMRCIVMDMPHNQEGEYRRIHALNELPTILEEWFPDAL